MHRQGLATVRTAAALGVVALVVAGGCSRGVVYRDTWRPAAGHNVHPALLHAAMALDPEDVQAVEGAGGVLIGHHATRGGYGTRAASVGGTHFVAVAGVTTAHSSCTSVGWCSITAGYRPTKIAVFRVEPGDWVKLPPHLIPPKSAVMSGVPAPVAREGCSVRAGWGSVKCSNSWRLVSP